jgi:hypothetical protein
MSVGMVVGGVVGGIIGFVIGGPYGAAIGIAIGAAAGYLVDPAKVSSPGAPDTQEFSFTTSREGLVIPDVLGTSKMTGNLLFYFENESEEQTESQGGKGGGGSEVVTGYKYYLSWLVGICLGEVDAVLSLFQEQDCIWSGIAENPGDGSPVDITVEGFGRVKFYFGTDNQNEITKIGEFIEDDTLNVPYRHLAYAYFKGCYVGEANRCPTMYFVVSKMPQFSFNTNFQIKGLEYNPAHALWYILNVRLGLTDGTGGTYNFLDSTSFSAVADQLNTEEFGIGVYMGQSMESLTWIQEILKTINGVLYYGVDGKIHLRLIRGGESVSSLPTVDEDIMLEDPTFERPSWAETKNECRVLYPLISYCEESTWSEQPPPEPDTPIAPTSMSSTESTGYYLGHIRYIFQSAIQSPGSSDAYFTVQVTTNDGSQVLWSTREDRNKSMDYYSGTTDSTTGFVEEIINWDDEKTSPHNVFGAQLDSVRLPMDVKVRVRMCLHDSYWGSKCSGWTEDTTTLENDGWSYEGGP